MKGRPGNASCVAGALMGSVVTGVLLTVLSGGGVLFPGEEHAAGGAPPRRPAWWDAIAALGPGSSRGGSSATGSTLCPAPAARGGGGGAGASRVAAAAAAAPPSSPSSGSAAPGSLGGCAGGASRLGCLRLAPVGPAPYGSFPVSLEEVAFIISSHDEYPLALQNYNDVFALWGRDAPHVYWYSRWENGTADGRPYFRPLNLDTAHERIPRMYTATWEAAPSHIRWFVSADDDTYFFIENLLDTLSQYDSALPWYLGDWSEDLQSLNWYSRMGYGGGGIAVSRPVMAALNEPGSALSLSQCLVRNAQAATGDEKLSRCIADLGVPLTRQPGFHQVDVRGDIRPVLWYVYSTSPLISLHHLKAADHILRGPNGPDNAAHMRALFAAYAAHEPSLLLGLHHTQDPGQKFTVALNFGHSVRIWPNVYRSISMTKFVPKSFGTWQPVLGLGFNFDIGHWSSDFACHYGLFEWTGFDGDVDAARAAAAAAVEGREWTDPDALVNATVLWRHSSMLMPAAAVYGGDASSSSGNGEALAGLSEAEGAAIEAGGSGWRRVVWPSAASDPTHVAGMGGWHTYARVIPRECTSVTPQPVAAATTVRVRLVPCFSLSQPLTVLASNGSHVYLAAEACRRHALRSYPDAFPDGPPAPPAPPPPADVIKNPDSVAAQALLGAQRAVVEEGFKRKPPVIANAK